MNDPRIEIILVRFPFRCLPYQQIELVRCVDTSCVVTIVDDYMVRSQLRECRALDIRKVELMAIADGIFQPMT